MSILTRRSALAVCSGSLRKSRFLAVGAFFLNHHSLVEVASGLALATHKRRLFLSSTRNNSRQRSNLKMSSSFARHGHDEDDEVCIHNSPFLESDGDDSSESVLVILNSPIPKPPSLLFQRLWNSSIYKICADGGANRLYDSCVDEKEQYIPDTIRGDLDSLRQEVRTFYQERGTSIQEDSDQNTNDLDKALQLIKTKQDEFYSFPPSNRRVCVYGAFGGRFDQEMAAIQALFNWSGTFQHKLVLYDDNTCAFLLPDVIRNEIRLPFYGESPPNEDKNASDDLVGEGPTCGLIPIGHRCEFVRTSGLKWNLDGSVALEFGGMVSTSNRAMENVVTVQASHPLVFTAEMTSGRRESE